MVQVLPVGTGVELVEVGTEVFRVPVPAGVNAPLKTLAEPISNVEPEETVKVPDALIAPPAVALPPVVEIVKFPYVAAGIV
jgi:hypothetical protein